MTTSFDRQMMSRALQLARRGTYSSRPNPTVGCLLVRAGKIVGEGFTRHCGGNHAEIEALINCRNPRGATAYVTLEPCSHHGRTGPCAQALIEAGISAVFIAMRDPNPLVSGSGVEKLQGAGVKVVEGLLEQEAYQLNAGFFQRMRTGKPRIRLKLASSLDGRSAMASGESQWITGLAARKDVQEWRARSDAIITGVDTVIHDDPALTVREPGLDIRRQPLRVIVDSSLRTPPVSKILRQDGETLIAYARDTAQGPALQAAGAELLRLPGAEQRVDLAALVQILAGRQCNDILVECGSRLAGAFVQSDLADEILLYQAAILLGSEARPLLELPLRRMADKRQLRVTDSRRIGDDFRYILEL